MYFQRLRAFVAFGLLALVHSLALPTMPGEGGGGSAERGDGASSTAAPPSWLLEQWVERSAADAILAQPIGRVLSKERIANVRPVLARPSLGDIQHSDGELPAASDASSASDSDDSEEESSSSGEEEAKAPPAADPFDMFAAPSSAPATSNDDILKMF